MSQPLLQFQQTSLPGVLLLNPSVHRDERGQFVKPYQKSSFGKLGVSSEFKEDFYSLSKVGVLRGLHFQSPPNAQAKIVYCTEGKVFDALLDLREGSSTYGKFETFELSASNARTLFIPEGIAHGFYVMEGPAVLIYKVSTEFSAELDSGILWNSAGIPWPNLNPILSDRDRALTPLDNFITPFEYKKAS